MQIRTPGYKNQKQNIEHYLKHICSLTQQYGIYTIEFSTPRKIHGKYVIQTNDIELELSKVFTDISKAYIIKIYREQTQISPTKFLQ